MLLLALSAGPALAFDDRCDVVEANIAAALTGTGCATPRLTVAIESARRVDPLCTAQVLARRGTARPALPPRPAVPNEKTVDNSYAEAPNRHETDNFVIWWGDPAGVFVDDIEGLADAFEAAWDKWVGDGWPMPLTAETYKLNVYIDGTDAGPPDTGAYVAGYYTEDISGRPIIVIGKGILGTSFADRTAAHEFFHAVQHGFQTLIGTTQSIWWFEATAVWSERHAYPDDDSTAETLGGFALRPDLPLNFFEAIQDGDVTESHTYGAFVWAEYLEEVHGPEIVEEVWRDSVAGDDPLQIAGDLLEEHGTTLQDAFFEFATRNATWDYERESAFESEILAAGGFGSGDSTRPADVIELPTDGIVTPDRGQPATYGSNYLDLRLVPARMRVYFEGFDARAWHAAIAGQFGDEHRSVPLVLDDNEGEIIVEGFDQADEVYLVVAAVNNLTDRGDRYPFQVDIGTAPPVESIEEPKSCGCDTPQAGWFGLWPAVALLGLRRRTR